MEKAYMLEKFHIKPKFLGVRLYSGACYPWTKVLEPSSSNISSTWSINIFEQGTSKTEFYNANKPVFRRFLHFLDNGNKLLSTLFQTFIQWPVTTCDDCSMYFSLHCSIMIQSKPNAGPVLITISLWLIHENKCKFSNTHLTSHR